MAEIATWICWGSVIVTWIAGAVYRVRASRGQRHGSGKWVLWRLGSVVAAAVAYRLAGTT
jgi:hypothetical protein